VTDRKAAVQSAPYKPPKGKKSHHSLDLGDETIDYVARADWMVLRKEEKPRAEMFHVSYLRREVDSGQRPLTFVFNGGPGASSAYLHVGALGPRRVAFNEDGTPPRPPVRLLDNAETWLAFTDLVFIDPVGTGFSRTIQAEKEADKNAQSEAADKKEYYRLKRDLESLGEFIQKYLSREKRWDSPIFIAGESYGGFRVGKLAKLLQEGYGVGLNGAILISPALEWMLLDPSDYDVLHWVDLFPSMAMAARHHGRSRVDADSDEAFREAIEQFAVTDYATCLVQGERLATADREAVYRQVADFLGLPEAVVALHGGRIPFHVFCRTLLKDRREVCGFYDATVTAVDPFPDRETHQAPDPTLYAIERIFAGGINTQLRKHLDLSTDRDYALLSMDVSTAWQVDTTNHAFERQVGASDDLRYALSLNPHMNLFITHGFYDLVTPYFSSNRLIEQMKLLPEQRQRITVQHFQGGHMFYAWEPSRKAFFSAMGDFYAASF
jgi:carboxypeptidase C (cathepsin A)